MLAEVFEKVGRFLTLWGAGWIGVIVLMGIDVTPSQVAGAALIMAILFPADKG